MRHYYIVRRKRMDATAAAASLASQIAKYEPEIVYSITMVQYSEEIPETPEGWREASSPYGDTICHYSESGPPLGPNLYRLPPAIGPSD